MNDESETYFIPAGPKHKMEKSLFSAMIRNGHEKKRRVGGNYVCKMYLNGEVTTSYLNIQPLMENGIVSGEGREDQTLEQPPPPARPEQPPPPAQPEPRPPPPAQPEPRPPPEPVAGPSRRRRRKRDNYIHAAECPERLDPSSSSDVDNEAEDESGDDEEPAPLPRFYPWEQHPGFVCKRRRNNEEQEENRHVQRRRAPKDDEISKTMIIIHNNEGVGKAKRLKEQVNVLRDIHLLEDEGMERRLQEMVKFLKASYGLRELRRDKIHQEKISLIRGFHEMGEEERELRHKEKLDKLITKQTTGGGTFAEGQRYNADLQKVFIDTEESDAELALQKDFEKCREFFLKEH